MTKTVSIIIPVYNQETLLEQTFESVLTQSYSDIEVIAVDDGSRDGSVAVLRSIRDDRLTVIAQDNAGQAAAINRGLAECSGEFIKIMDGDDILNVDHIDSQARAIAGFEYAVASSRWAYFVDDPATAIPVEEVSDRDYDDPFRWVIDTLTESRGMFGAWQWLIPRPLLERAGYWNETLSLEADFEFSIRLLLASEQVRFASDAMLYYRKGVGSSMSRGKSRAFLVSAVEATELSVRRLANRDNSDRTQRLCADRCQKWAYETYPSQPALTVRAEQLAREFGGSSLPMPGGRISAAMGMILPWKAIRRIQGVAYQAGWQHVLSRKERKRNLRLQRNESQETSR